MPADAFEPERPHQRLVLLGAQQPTGATVADGLLEQIAPEMLLGALVLSAGELDDGDK